MTVTSPNPLRSCCHGILILAIYGSLSSCNFFRATPAEDSGFIKKPGKMSLVKSRYPFNAVWVSDKYKKNRTKYTKLLVKPVNTAYVVKTGDWHHIKIKGKSGITRDIKTFAKKIEQSLDTTFQKQPKGRVSLTNKADSKTLILEMALVELVPTDVVRDAAGDVLGFMVPGGGLVSVGSGGSVAIEGRFRDGATNEVLWTFKDREVDQIAPVDLAGLSPYRHTEVNVHLWAKEIYELLNSPMDHKVTHPLPFTLSPW